MPLRSSTALACLLALLLLHAGPARSEWTGRVFIDANENGEWEPSEAALPGVLVSNGRELTTTDADGLYGLPEREGFVAISRPAQFDAPGWYANGSSDFGLRPASQSQEDFFFVQVSDSHVYDRIQDFPEFSMPDIPWFLPDYLVERVLLLVLDNMYEETAPDGLVAVMRETLMAEARENGADPEELERISDLGSVGTLRAYSKVFDGTAGARSDVADAARRAFEEVASLKPSFVINTGDLVLEGNGGSPDAVDRWFRFYQSITENLGVPFYNTIGNNEIAGSQNSKYEPTDPGYGKQSFERFYGPTHYSFDYGAFHFIALDTHRQDPDDIEDWTFRYMAPDVQQWLEAELEASKGRVPVILNHEPFHEDPGWPYSIDPAYDYGLFERFRVPYVLSGHVHQNSFQPGDPTTHITTGALSGMRWILPKSVHPRGYRLFYARGTDLHSAWKELDKAVIALAEGGRQADRWVVAAADTRGPFASVTITRAGEPLQAERWGSYFWSVPRQPGAEPLQVEALRHDGERLTRTLQTTTER